MKKYKYAEWVEYGHGGLDGQMRLDRWTYKQSDERMDRWSMMIIIIEGEREKRGGKGRQGRARKSKDRSTRLDAGLPPFANGIRDSGLIGVILMHIEMLVPRWIVLVRVWSKRETARSARVAW